VLDAVSQDVHHATPGDLALQTGQELLPFWSVGRQMQLFEGLWLRHLKEG